MTAMIDSLSGDVSSFMIKSCVSGYFSALNSPKVSRVIICRKGREPHTLMV